MDDQYIINLYMHRDETAILENEYNMSHGKMAKQMYQLRGNLKAALEKEGYNL